jgi:hypothetical protein
VNESYIEIVLDDALEFASGREYVTLLWQHTELRRQLAALRGAP